MSSEMLKFVRRAIGTVVAGVFVSLCLPASPASASLWYDRWERTAAMHSDKCLEVADWSTANGAVVRQWDCHPGENQLWLATETGQVVSHVSGKCLEVADWSTANGAAVRQWGCTGGANQQWELMGTTTAGGTDVLALRNVHSGKCLEIADWRTDNGAPARQWDCHYGKNQLFA